MRAFVIESHGGSDALHLISRPVPQPNPGEVRLRVRAVALNHLDLWVRRGVPGHVFPLPLVPGSDMAGTVTQVGPGVTPWSVGQDVLIAPGVGCGQCPSCFSGQEQLCRSYAILGETRDGGCAEEAVVPARNIMSPPAGLSWAEAVSLPLSLLTAWHMLLYRAELRPGELVLIHAGGSGVGVMAIQIAKLFGATVLTTVGSASKVDLVRGLGADHVILYREVDFVEEVRRLTGKRGVNLVCDHVGGEIFERSTRVLQKGGRLVTCGATSGAAIKLDLRPLFFKGLSYLGSTMGNRGELCEAMRLVENGRIRPVVDRVFAMEELARAHEYLESRSAMGKVIIAGFDVSRESLEARPEATGAMNGPKTAERGETRGATAPRPETRGEIPPA